MKKNEQITGCRFLAISIGLVYLWFGVLKFFPHLSPAEDLAINTITILTLGKIPPNVSIILLAIWETLIGIFLLTKLLRRPIIILALVHMLFTFTPLLFFPKESFTLPFVFTLLGQYIFKNLIIIAALITLYYQALPKQKQIQTNIS